MRKKANKIMVPHGDTKPMTAEQALVALWDGLMRQWREGCPTATVMLSSSSPAAVEAYQKVYGPNVVPIFAAMGKRNRRSVA